MILPIPFPLSLLTYKLAEPCLPFHLFETLHSLSLRTGIEEAAAAPQSMQDQTINLSQVVSVFKLDGQSQATKIVLQRPELSAKVTLLRNEPMPISNRPSLIGSA